MTPWTVAHQAPLSMGRDVINRFSDLLYWSCQHVLTPLSWWFLLFSVPLVVLGKKYRLLISTLRDSVLADLVFGTKNLLFKHVFTQMKMVLIPLCEKDGLCPA